MKPGSPYYVQRILETGYENNENIIKEINVSFFLYMTLNLLSIIVFVILFSDLFFNHCMKKIIQTSNKSFYVYLFTDQRAKKFSFYISNETILTIIAT